MWIYTESIFCFLIRIFLFFVWQAIFPFINSFICPLSNDSDHNKSDRKWKMQVFCCCWLMNLKKWKQTTNFMIFFRECRVCCWEKIIFVSFPIFSCLKQIFLGAVHTNTVFFSMFTFGHFVFGQMWITNKLHGEKIFIKSSAKRLYVCLWKTTTFP